MALADLWENSRNQIEGKHVQQIISFASDGHLIWYYEIPLPEGRNNYTKTKPMQFEEFADCISWFKKKRRDEDDHAWSVKAADVLKYNGDGNLVSCNLDLKNPNGADVLEHLPPEKLAADILKKEQRIIEIMEEITAELGGGKNG
jgi:type I restriction enzyme M protein